MYNNSIQTCYLPSSTLGHVESQKSHIAAVQIIDQGMVPTTISLWDKFSEFEAAEMAKLLSNFPVAISLRLKLSLNYDNFNSTTPIITYTYLYYTYIIYIPAYNLPITAIKTSQVLHLQRVVHLLSFLIRPFQKQLGYAHGA
ncbi:uncharacterized protein LOC131336718 [Rhododendron vialii]|uniref:uncharacterized protein LOC131336718 n=1 Tax=Rhododendron vialii TaxID=182163 RepID=UPI00265F96D1|nr:uncharacterized protein LOC131336718 [Rhododendron vialii]